MRSAAGETTPAAGETTPAVVVAGDALVDLTPATTVRGGRAYEPHPGGSCLNVAVGLGRLGVPTAFLGRLSTDRFGGLLREHLAASGVSARYVLPTDDLTTLAIVHLVEGQATYAFHAAEAADRGLLPSHLAGLPGGGALPDGSALHVGSLGLVLEPVASTLEGLLRRESGRRLVTLDPNVRPGLVADRDAYRRRFERQVALVDVVKASEEDLAWLYPGVAEEDVVARWLAAGVRLVVVTAGGEGARATTPAGAARVGAPPVAVVDTVGAGDAFTAGVLAHLHDHAALDREAVGALGTDGLAALLDAAAAVAADTCTRPGADPPRRAQLGRPPRGGGPPEATMRMTDLVERARALAVPGQRRLLGVTGPPGAGKSTVAAALVAALGPHKAVLVPMDGFHLSNEALRALGRQGRKGAWDTFDAGGFAHLLRRLRAGDEAVVYAPDFDRDLEEPIGSALPVPREVALVVTEGNYLLLDRGPWAGVGGLLDETWYLDAPDDARLARLARRHEQHGKPPEQALAWAHGSDQANAELIAATRPRADLVVRLAG
ncbi:MAG TPA: nucleoside/nucleotide kinase family protein [Egibacteraceae bacterium]|nr:nucleoside/nucleotide kinase family protein [Egibacteraceae bacterium]